MKAISLHTPKSLYGNFPEETQEGKDFIAFVENIYDKVQAGEKVYIKITGGDYGGSICYIKTIESFRAKFIRRSSLISNDKDLYLFNYHFSFRPKWTGKSNSPEMKVWQREATYEYLPNYNGPTIFKKFDAKYAAERYKKNIVVKDRRGDEIKVGEPVTYINTRYGGGSRLDFGVVEDIEFKVEPNGRYSVLVTVRNVNKDQVSKISNPNEYIILN